MDSIITFLSSDACLSLLQLTEDVAHVGYWVWNITTGEVIWSKAKIHIYGENSTTFKPTFDKFMAVLDEPTRARVLAEIDAVLKGEKRYYDLQHRIHLRNGRTAWVHEKGVVIRDEMGTPIRMEGVVYDITERMLLLETLRDQHQKIDYLQTYNPITGLPGKKALEKTLFHLLATHQSFYLAILDLSDFGTVNSQYGHAYGDAVLNTLGKRLAKAFPDQLFHYNADEFTVILPANEWALHCEQLYDLVREPLHVEDKVFHLSANLGCSHAPVDAATPTGLIRTAQTALRYLKRHKENPPNTHFVSFSPEMQEALGRRHRLAEALRNELQHTPDHFEVFYQPQVDMNTGRPIGMEALVRWHSPDEGLISPGEFLPIAQEEGLMAQLDTLVLEKAVAQWRIWRRQYPVQLSFNCLISDLNDPAFHEVLEKLPSLSGLTLELTEAEMLKCDQRERAIINRLRDRGIRISIDDFGTGYSSLRYLHQLPFDELKIDRSFITNLPESQQDADLVRLLKYIVDMFNLASIVEGVETQAQATFLTHLGFSHAQGFLYGKPLSVEDMSRWLAETI